MSTKDTTWSSEIGQKIDGSIYLHPIITPQDYWANGSLRLDINWFTRSIKEATSHRLCDVLIGNEQKDCIQKYVKAYDAHKKKIAPLLNDSSYEEWASSSCIEVSQFMQIHWENLNKLVSVGIGVGVWSNKNHTGSLANYPSSMEWNGGWLTFQEEIYKLNKTAEGYPSYAIPVNPVSFSGQLYFASTGSISHTGAEPNITTSICAQWVNNSVVIYLRDLARMTNFSPITLRWKTIGGKFTIHKSNWETLVIAPEKDSARELMLPINTLDILRTDDPNFEHSINLSQVLLKDADYLEILP